MSDRKEKLRLEKPEQYRKEFLDYRKIKMEEDPEGFRLKEANSQKTYSRTDKGLATKIVRSAKSRVKIYLLT